MFEEREKGGVWGLAKIAVGSGEVFRFYRNLGTAPFEVASTKRFTSRGCFVEFDIRPAV
jgi:hypothetical protein